MRPANQRSSTGRFAVGRFGASLTVAVLVAAPLVGCQAVASPVVIPAEYKSYFTVAAKRCPGVLTPWGLAAQAYAESSFDQHAVSPAGAEGLMQILPEVWRRYGTDANGDGVADPFTVPDSIATSAKINCDLSKSVATIPGNQTDLRLAAYNAGLGAVQQYDGVPPFPETENYIKRVEQLTMQFESQFKSPAATSSKEAATSQ